MRYLALVLSLLLLPCPVWSLTSAQYSQLKTELESDPMQLGYNVDPTFYVTNNADAALAPMLNAVHEGVPYQIDAVITNTQLWNAATSADLDALATPKRVLLQIALQVASYDMALPETSKKLGEIFPAGSGTATNIAALQKRQGSRAEVLFGRGTSLRVADISCALRQVSCP